MQSAQQQQQVQQAGFQLDKVGKFVHDNSIPRYILYGIILCKSVLIYDKLKQLVALNQTHASLMKDQSVNLKKYFASESELQDLLTKRILESRDFNDIEDDFGDSEESKYALTGSTSYSAKAKQQKFDWP